MTLSTVRAVLGLVAAEVGASIKISADDMAQIKANLDEIYRYAKRNDIAHLVGHALIKNGLISERDNSFPLFEGEQYTAMLRQERQDFELGRICEVLEGGGIDFIPLKGAVLRRLYPEPWMRTSCDIDILVKKEDFAAAKKCLLEDLGYKRGKESSHDESFDAPGRVHIELHFDLLEDGQTRGARKIIENVWSHTVPAEGKKHHMLMSDEMFYFYHIAHIAKHFEEAGIGARPFLDLYLLTLGRENDAKRDDFLKRGGLDVFERVARELVNCWFAGGELGNLGQRFEIFILRCGAYGALSNSILLAKEKRGGSRGYILSRIFMPYDSIKYSYPILKKHKWLLPFCQISRWFKLLSPKRAKRAAREAQRSSELSDKELRRLKTLMQDVGLE